MDDEVRIWVDSFLKTKVHGSENFTIQHLATYEQKSNQSFLARNCSLETSSPDGLSPSVNVAIIEPSINLSEVLSL